MAELALSLDPAGWLTDRATEAAREAAEPMVHGIASALWRGLSQACADIAHEVVAALSDPAGIDLRSGWWSGPRTRELMGVVMAIAAALTVAFLLLAVIQGLLAGDPIGMLRSALGHVPLAVLGMVAVVGVTDLLIRLTDGAAAAVLSGTGNDLSALASKYGARTAGATGGLAAIILLCVFLFGALLVWAELVVRAALVYLLVALAPLALAARVWPATRGIFRRLCEIGVALVISKFAVALALALGVVALVGGGTTTAADGHGLSLSGLLAGATLMGLAAFTPFVLLRLLPVLESAVLAQGITRSPVRGAQVAVAASAYPARLARLAGRAVTGGGAATKASTAKPHPHLGTNGSAIGSSQSARRLAGAGSGPGRRAYSPIPETGGQPASRNRSMPKGAGG